MSRRGIYDFATLLKPCQNLTQSSRIACSMKRFEKDESPSKRRGLTSDLELNSATRAPQSHCTKNFTSFLQIQISRTNRWHSFCKTRNDDEDQARASSQVIFQHELYLPVQSEKNARLVFKMVTFLSPPHPLSAKLDVLGRSVSASRKKRPFLYRCCRAAPIQHCKKGVRGFANA